MDNEDLRKIEAEILTRKQERRLARKSLMVKVGNYL